MRVELVGGSPTTTLSSPHPTPERAGDVSRTIIIIHILSQLLNKNSSLILQSVATAIAKFV